MSQLDRLKQILARKSSTAQAPPPQERERGPTTAPSPRHSAQITQSLAAPVHTPVIAPKPEKAWPQLDDGRYAHAMLEYTSLGCHPVLGKYYDAADRNLYGLVAEYRGEFAAGDCCRQPSHPRWGDAGTCWIGSIKVSKGYIERVYEYQASPLHTEP